MLDLGWSEMAMVAMLALVVIGPRDLPKVMRTAGRYVRQARGYMRDFQTNLEKMVEEEGLEDVKETAQRARRFDSNKEMEDLVDPDKSVRNTATDVERSARTGGEQADGEPAAVPASEASTTTAGAGQGNGSDAPAADASELDGGGAESSDTDRSRGSE